MLRLTVCSAVAFTVLPLLAGPIPIAEGRDGFLTQPGTIVNVQEFFPSGIAAGAFPDKNGEMSLPIAAADLPTALPVGPGVTVLLPEVTTFAAGPGCHNGTFQPGHHHCYAQERVIFNPVDTIIFREAGVLDGVLTVSILFEYLSLKSMVPLEVKYPTEPSSFFDIFIELDGPQTPGSLKLTQDALNMHAGTMDTVLPIKFMIRIDGGPTINGFQDVMASNGHSFTVVPEPGQTGVTIAGLISLGACAWLRRRRLQLQSGR